MVPRMLASAPTLQAVSPLTSRLGLIPSGASGIHATLRLMRDIVRQYKTNLSIRHFAMQLVANVPDKDFEGEVYAVFSWVRDNIRYTRDVNGVETLQTPDKTIQLGQGDCDDQAVLVSSLLESIGFQTRFTAIGFQPGIYQHVFCEVMMLDHSWIPLETTEGSDVGLAWRPANVRAIMRIEN